MGARYTNNGNRKQSVYLYGWDATTKRNSGEVAAKVASSESRTFRKETGEMMSFDEFWEGAGWIFSLSLLCFMIVAPFIIAKVLDLLVVY